MARRARSVEGIDTELEHLSPEMRWREWMSRVEAVIFAASFPVSRETLSRIVGRDCNIDLIIDDIREELYGRPYDVVAVAGGFQYRTRPAYASVIRASGAPSAPTADLTRHEAALLVAIGYFQPVTRADLSKIFGKEVSRDTIAGLRHAGLIASGPRSPTPGAPYTYVTTPEFLSAFGFNTLRDLPDIEMLEDAGLLNRESVAAAEMPPVAEDEEEGEDEIGIRVSD
ncbi:SMC-Scp complex subunit ScpB [Rhizobiaceae bacterium n13]|uniref:SMC-Scp complex subunit ScpB n=1 Tax=Ferirhizobium litorale TaxID=2927786 RepID=A0AAE3U461_9HYPH|nr:SMC-Scp complex subunit ScpB [Fererhizobium litorale]MDI7862049.1 SMC-Scp complex subunit ScpB [Fererhizobium litorale]MDI7922679.1 SMC-Scp complex subunit ScpB [Fererhizobium litorale]